MRTFLRAAVLAGVIVPFAHTTTASAQVAGVWLTSQPTQVRNENGVETATDSVLITLTLEQRGDSVFGVWERASREGMPPSKPRKLAGVLRTGQIVLTAEPVEAKMRRGDEEETIQMILTYNLHVDGDTLAGTQSAESTDGMVQASERPFVAKRKKS